MATKWARVSLAMSAGQRRLAGPGRTPEDEREELVALDGLPQQRTLADELFVTDDLRERTRAHARRKRRRLLQRGAAVGLKQIHGDLNWGNSRFIESAICRSRSARSFSNSAPVSSAQLVQPFQHLRRQIEPQEQLIDGRCFLGGSFGIPTSFMR